MYIRMEKLLRCQSDLLTDLHKNPTFSKVQTFFKYILPAMCAFTLTFNIVKMSITVILCGKFRYIAEHAEHVQ